MNVKTLIAALELCDPDARVILTPLPELKDNAPDIVYIAVTSVDDTDTLVALANGVAGKRGETVTDCPPQFKRFRVSTDAGADAAKADLLEQANCEPTHDLHNLLEVERMKATFRRFEELLSRKGGKS